jgi:phenylpropionate dioxygenase-like ring-hydroxylating dioxygenase large terminal subunit
MFLAHTNQKLLLDLPQTNKTKRLVTTSAGTKLLSNICPHQRSKLNLVGSTLSCPYHAWTFTIEGKPIGNGNTECKNHVDLEQYPLYQVGNFLFDIPVDLPHLDFLHNDYLELVEYRVDEVDAPKEVIIDLFLDVSHIPIMHKGVYDQIGIDHKLRVDWYYSNNSSLQLVYRDDSTSEYSLEFDTKLGYKAAWLTLYPGTMIEWQPGAMFITIAENTKFGYSKVHVFKYRDTRYNTGVWKLNIDIWETAWQQDKDQSELIDGINYTNLEQGKQHYVDWCNNEHTKT